MTYKRQGRHIRRAAPRTAIVATLAIVAGFLASTISVTSAAAATTTSSATTTTVATTTTATTTTTTAAHDHHKAAHDHHKAGNDHYGRARLQLLRCSERYRAWPHRLVGKYQRPFQQRRRPRYALDGNSATRFSTDEDQASGLYLEVNLGSRQSFYALQMAVPNSPTDYARGLTSKSPTTAPPGPRSPAAQVQLPLRRSASSPQTADTLRSS